MEPMAGPLLEAGGGGSEVQWPQRDLTNSGVYELYTVKIMGYMYNIIIIYMIYVNMVLRKEYAGIIWGSI